MNLSDKALLFLDFETASMLDLTVVGQDRYFKHPTTRPLMLSWKLINCGQIGKTHLWLPHKNPMPDALRSYLEMYNVVKVAWNAGFEHGALKHLLGIDVPWEQWMDVMVWARHMSLPGKLGDCGKALGLPEDKAKITEGKALIKFFCEPYKLGGEVTLFGIAPPEFHDWNTHPREWKQFEDYCIRDTDSEFEIFNLIPTPLPQSEQDLWVMDQIINERGIPTNRKFSETCYSFAVKNRDLLLKDLSAKTGLTKPNSPAQLLPWLRSHGYPYKSLNKKFAEAALKNPKLPKEASDVLLLRQSTAKIAYTKLETLLEMLNEEDNLCNQFIFMGASRSGRWSGSGVQPHNLPRPIKWVEKHLEEAMNFVNNNDYDGLTATLALEEKPPSIIDVMTSLIRSCFQAPEGEELDVCDLNAIENRVLGWVSGCQSILDVFTTISSAGKAMCPYLSFAALMYKIPYDVLEKTYNGGDVDAKEKRQVAKSAVLGAGYGLGSGVNRFCTQCGEKLKFRDEVCKSHPKKTVRYAAVVEDDGYGNDVFQGLVGYAQNMGINLTPEQAYQAWKAFRAAYSEVVEGWDALQSAAIEVLTNGGEVETCYVTFDRIEFNGTYIMRIKLPSGRYLHYMNARIQLEEKVSEAGRTYVSKNIMYDGIGHGVGAISAGWGPVYTYGGKLMENIVQAISRDILAWAMKMAHDKGAKIVLHVHDEIATMRKKIDAFAFGFKDLHFCLSSTPWWAPGLPLGAAGFTGRYYKK